MKVLLKEDVDNLGYAGEVMDVANGYGRNYLIPKGYAVMATPGVLNQASSWRERAAVRMAEVRKEHEALAAKISGATLEFEARAGDTGKLYGSVTTAEIVDKLNEELGTEIDRRKVIADPIRQLGEHHVTVRLSRDYNPFVTVNVIPFMEDEEEVELLEGTEGDDEAGETTEELAEMDLEVEELKDSEPTVSDETTDDEAA